MIYHQKSYGSVNKHYLRQHSLDVDPTLYELSTEQHCLLQSTNEHLQFVTYESSFSVEYNQM